MVQWLRLHTANAGGSGSIPGQGTRSHVLQLRATTAKQINRCLKKKKKDHVGFEHLIGWKVTFMDNTSDPTPPHPTPYEIGCSN